MVHGVDTLLLAVSNHRGLVHTDPVLPCLGPLLVVPERHHLVGPSGSLLVDGVVAGGRSGDQVEDGHIGGRQFLLIFHEAIEVAADTLEGNPILSIVAHGIRDWEGRVFHDAVLVQLGDIVAVHVTAPP